jgi:leucyl aminopeptidase
MRFSFTTPSIPKAGAYVTLFGNGQTLSEPAASADNMLNGAVSRGLVAFGNTGKKGECIDLPTGKDMGYQRLIALSIGKPNDFHVLDAQNLGGELFSRLSNSGVSQVTIDCTPPKGSAIADEIIASEIAFGMKLASYRFNKYRSKEDNKGRASLNSVRMQLKNNKEARKLFASNDKIADGVHIARDLLEEPPNILYPESFASRCLELRELGVEVQVLTDKNMAKLGMGALLGVAQGSARPARMVIMRWRGRKGVKQPLVLVGKGVTFDTGGISIKPAGGMEDMKYDMGGAAAVVGTMAAIAGRKAKADVVGVIGLVENMPSANAQRPGDIVKTMSGQTVEVINTDAEGRLVLADAIWHAQKKFNPSAIIDLATLTGAIIISLGSTHAGLFSNNDDLAQKLDSAGKASGETVWRMPLNSAYDKQLSSNVADMKNVGGREAGSITAAQFIQRFVTNNTPWAHLDIAGVAWTNQAKPTTPKGGVGFGVRLLDRLIAQDYES